MRRFDINKLPKNVREKIDLIEWQDGTLNEDLAGLVYIKDGWCIDVDGSHTEGFTNRTDLINFIRGCVIKEGE